MAVVYPTNDPQPVQPVHPGLVQEAETHPIWAVVIVGVLAVAAYAVISRLRGSSSASSTPAAAQTPTTEYVPTRNYFVNIAEGGQQPPTPTPGGPLPPVPGPPGPQPKPPGPNPNPGPGNGYNGTPLIPYGDYTGPGYGAGQFHFGQ